MDFALMRARLGLPKDADILKSVQRQPEPQQSHSMRIIEELEAEWRENLQLEPTARATLQAIHERGLATAIVTRNSKAAVDHFHQHLRMPHVLQASRDRSFLPCKPSPAPLLDLCQHHGVAPTQAAMVGDAADDILSGRAAGSWTVLLATAQHRRLSPEAHERAMQAQPHVVVETLEELLAHIAGES
eukprot:TRINITY_DN2577_c0_g1_i1.p2 TRINITY_DN2577_c0_g1~~TRINITY_DN2577_c0_g1_i1.p2  ORF type:complete len:187 (+),score=37.79 TRINITY_DN2577_c0_g1_i1:232-792(+)